ncbi:farnesyl pyrophosphate synthase 1-like isoform X1 [Harmonia axyridis]|uniref:farnesyl pyrophosphate synthase 1-like isoform X1 n=1 Tax=Harmonia axyridis TaxID=115357 RepID=UPI001E277DB2|nr:farnesyl pyrophosphate synthase 1-like isoform X1 [Harmonia axyridis]
MLKNSVNILGFAKRLKYTPNNIFPSIGYYSTVSKKKIYNHHDMKFLPQKDMDAFMAYMPKFVEDVTSSEVMLYHPPCNQRMKRFLEYMLPAGKRLRQHVMIFTYKAIEEHHGTFSPEKMQEMYKLCWCLELYNQGNTIMDDIIDDHENRRGKPTWYHMEGTKAAVGDMIVVYTLVKRIMKKYFQHHPKYPQLLETIFPLEIPLSLVLELETKNFDDFTLERCDEISEMKCGYYISVQPLLLTTLLANKEFELNEQAKKIFFYLGYLYHTQNDLLDIYGEDLAGKSGKDIGDNRITYLIAMAQRKASDSQMKRLRNNYGKRDPECIAAVKEIYDELDILGEYYKQEEEYLEKVSEEIQKIPHGFSRTLIEKIAYVQSFGLIGVPPFK